MSNKSPSPSGVSIDPFIDTLHKSTHQIGKTLNQLTGVLCLVNSPDGVIPQEFRRIIGREPAMIARRLKEIVKQVEGIKLPVRGSQSMTYQSGEICPIAIMESDDFNNFKVISCRNLTIYPHPNNSDRPMIRFGGLWLQQAGFEKGNSVKIEVTSHGLFIRNTEPSAN